MNYNNKRMKSAFITSFKTLDYLFNDGFVFFFLFV